MNKPKTFFFFDALLFKREKIKQIIAIPKQNRGLTNLAVTKTLYQFYKKLPKQKQIFSNNTNALSALETKTKQAYIFFFWNNYQIAVNTTFKKKKAVKNKNPSMQDVVAGTEQISKIFKKNTTLLKKKRKGEWARPFSEQDMIDLSSKKITPEGANVNMLLIFLLSIKLNEQNKTVTKRVFLKKTIRAVFSMQQLAIANALHNHLWDKKKPERFITYLTVCSEIQFLFHKTICDILCYSQKLWADTCSREQI